MEQYLILVGTTTARLEENVNAHLKQGWVLSGGMTIEHSFGSAIGFYQAVYKPKA